MEGNGSTVLAIAHGKQIIDADAAERDASQTSGSSTLISRLAQGSAWCSGTGATVTQFTRICHRRSSLFPKKDGIEIGEVPSIAGLTHHDLRKCSYRIDFVVQRELIFCHT
jgi:hypothetical protein